MTPTPHPARCPSCAGFLPPEIAGQNRIEKCHFCQAPIPAEVFDDHPTRERNAVALRASIQEAERRRIEFDEHRRSERAALASRYRKELTDENQLSGDETSMAMAIPGFDSQLTPLSDERKQKFVDRLRIIAEEALSKDRICNSQYYEEEAGEDQSAETFHDRVVGACCATCRGACCQNGAEHAFFTRDLLRHRAGQHGFVSVDELIEAYRSKLPERSYEGSCVFHTDKGCTLPSDMRSMTCNAFFCSALDDFRTNPPGPEVVEIGVIAQQDGQRLRTVVVR